MNPLLFADWSRLNRLFVRTMWALAALMICGLCIALAMPHTTAHPAMSHATAHPAMLHATAHPSAGPHPPPAAAARIGATR
jgi:hypothetical protein